MKKHSGHGLCRWAFALLLPLLLVGPAAGQTPGDRQEETREPYIESWKVAARSLVLPGWGQFRLGESARGQAYLAVAAVGAALAFELVRFSDRENGRSSVRGIGWGIYGVSALLSSSSAWQSAERRNRENGWELGAVRLPSGSIGVALTLRR